MEQEVQEYFEAYFGETLNESTTGEDIMESVYDLIALRDVVLESVGLDEKTTQRQSGQAFFDRLRLHPVREIGKMGKEAQNKFAERIRASNKKRAKSAMSSATDMSQTITADVEHDGDEIQEKKKTGLTVPTLQDYMRGAHKQSIRGQQQSGKTLKRIQGFIKAKQLLQDAEAKTPAVIDGVVQGDRLNKKKLGTGNAYKVDTVQGKPVDEMYNTTLDSYIDKVDKQINKDGSTDTSVPNWKKRARGLSKAKHRKATGNWEFDEKDAQAKEKARNEDNTKKKVKELAPEELAISPERLADTRENIKKYLNSKKKK